MRFKSQCRKTGQDSLLHAQPVDVFIFLYVGHSNCFKSVKKKYVHFYLSKSYIPICLKNKNKSKKKENTLIIF